LNGPCLIGSLFDAFCPVSVPSQRCCGSTRPFSPLLPSVTSRRFGLPVLSCRFSLLNLRGEIFFLFPMWCRVRLFLYQHLAAGNSKTFFGLFRVCELVPLFPQMLGTKEGLPGADLFPIQIKVSALPPILGVTFNPVFFRTLPLLVRRPGRFWSPIRFKSSPPLPWSMGGFQC